MCCHSAQQPPSFVATWAIWSRKGQIRSENCSPSSLPVHARYHYNRVMIRWTCYVRHDQIAISDDFLNKLKFPELETGLRTNRLIVWTCYQGNGWINQASSLVVSRREGPGRPKKSRRETLANDLKDSGLQDVDSHDKTGRNPGDQPDRACSMCGEKKS